MIGPTTEDVTVVNVKYQSLHVRLARLSRVKEKIRHTDLQRET